MPLPNPLSPSPYITYTNGKEGTHVSIFQQPLTDHHLKTISFIADIGNIIVVMARLSTESESKTWTGKMPDFSPHKEKQEEKTTKVICHVLETAEVRCSKISLGASVGRYDNRQLRCERYTTS
jgi:hypothetical protein